MPFCSCVFSPFSIAITSLGEERANLSAFCTFDRFVLVWSCRFSLPLGVWEGLRFVIVALPGLFSYFFYGKVSFSPLQIFKNCRPRTRRILCNVCLVGVVIVLLHVYVYSSFFLLEIQCVRTYAKQRF